MSFNYFLLFLAIATAIASWVFAFGSRWLAHRTEAIAMPGGRHIHRKPIPQLGGLGIGAVILIAIAVGSSFGWFAPSLKPLQILGFAIGILFLMIGGYLDDRYDLPAKHLVWFPLLAAISIALTGTRIHEITNPFGGHPIVFPAWLGDALTILWLLAVTAATKFADGIDGLVAGQTVIGAGLILGLTLSAAFRQPAMAVLAAVIGASYLGFLPSNYFPAKQFLGESGSTIAGFSLGFLSIASGAKVATALMALGIPLADIVFVMLRRIRRGRSPFRGDTSHLHFRLLAAGLTPPKAVAVMWGLSLLFGILAFGLQTRGKILLLFVLCVIVLGLSAVLGARTRPSSYGPNDRS